METHEMIGNIKTKEDFVKFLHYLREDYKDNPDQWENPDLSRYLEAITAFTEAIEQAYKNNDIKMHGCSVKEFYWLVANVFGQKQLSKHA